MILHVYPGSGSRIQGSKKYWIRVPDPQHCLLGHHNFLFLEYLRYRYFTINTFYLTNLKTKKDPFSPSRQMANLSDVRYHAMR
jgi:hypothetical protein